MAELLLIGSRGEEVRRLQRNLNAALAGQVVLVDGHNAIPLETQTGIFGKRTKAAVERFQKDYQLKLVDGKVGDETRKALAMRVLVVHGSVTRNANPSPSPGPTPPPKPTPPKPAPTPPPAPQPAPSSSPANKKSWLFQAQPALGITPPPFFSTGSGSGPSILQGQVALGFVYRTASEGPHWEFGIAGQPSVNTTNSPTDPHYTLQLQGSVTYADPYRRGRFHTALYGQVLAISNFSPTSLAFGAQLGAQISFDIIDDKWNIYSQAGVQALGQWNLYGPGGGEFNFGPVFTILGTTIQWDLSPKKK